MKPKLTKINAAADRMRAAVLAVAEEYEAQHRISIATALRELSEVPPASLARLWHTIKDVTAKGSA